MSWQTEVRTQELAQFNGQLTTIPCATAQIAAYSPRRRCHDDSRYDRVEYGHWTESQQWVPATGGWL